MAHQAEKNSTLTLEWGVASRAIPGETVSGDSWLVEPVAGGALLAVVDGLGHGSEATAAAELAVSTLREHAGESVLSLIDHCHAALRTTRGVVLSLASFNESDASLTWLGIGNVEGVLVRSSAAAVPPRENLLLRGGVVGYQVSLPRAVMIPVAAGDLLVFATDGVQPGFEEDVSPGEAVQSCADRLLARHVKPTDDALVLAARFLPSVR
jgi:negative regulator of sigma-B (phosphoserine phosphatase)